jgi:magnesium transporter
MGHTRLYRDGQLVSEGFAVNEISTYLKDESAVVWYDLCGPTEEDIASISEELGLHRLAVEDALHEHERPKLDRYPSHLFLTCYAIELDTITGQVRHPEVSAFITPRALVTVRKSEDFAMREVVARWDAEPDLLQYGVSFLLHGLIDYVVDTHFGAVRALDEQMESLEDLLFDDRPTDREMQRRTFELRKSLVRMRKVVLPMREVVNALLRRDLHPLSPDMQPYYQDVYDHVLRVTEWIDSMRDLVTTIFETHLNARSNRLNVIMKQVTSWAAIIAVPTAVTGFYGQNVPYPGFGNAWGFWTSTIVTLTLSGMLYGFFRRKGWI